MLTFYAAKLKPGTHVQPISICLRLCLCLRQLRRTCKPGRRKHKHKRKERKLKNSDKLSAYILVRHVRIESCAKGQSGRGTVPHFYASALVFVTYCLCLSYVKTSLCLCLCLCLCLRRTCKPGLTHYLELPTNLHILFTSCSRRFVLNFTVRQRSVLDLKRAKQGKSPWVKIKRKPGLKKANKVKVYSFNDNKKTLQLAVEVAC